MNKPEVHAITCTVVGCSPAQAEAVENVVAEVLDRDCDIVEKDSLVTGSAPSSRKNPTVAVQIEIVGPIEHEPELGRVCDNIAHAVRDVTGKNVRVSRHEAGKRVYWTYLPKELATKHA